MNMAIMETLKKLVGRVPIWVWLAVGGLLVGAFWLRQHDERIRQQARLQQLRSETSAQVAALRKQAAQDVRHANVENAQAIQKLEARRQQVEQQNLQLHAQLASLRQQAQVQADAVATLPISEIVTRVATQLGLTAEDFAPEEKAISRKGAKAQSKLQVANYELPKPASEAAQAADMAKSATSAPPKTKKTPHPVRSCGTSLSLRRVPGRESVADIAKNATSAPPDARDDSGVALALTSSGARKVETSLVELNACHAENAIERQQVSNGQARAQADDATISRLNNSVAILNQAVEAKDHILTRQQSECKAELRAARGTFLGRVARLTEHVAIGVAMGVAIGVAVK